MLRRRPFWILLAVIAVVAGLAFITLWPDVLNLPAKPLPSTETADQGIYSEHAAYYDISASYATSTALSTTVGERADLIAVGLMKGFITTSIAQFKTDGNFANLTPKDITMMGYDQGRKQSLQISYLTSASPRTVSYIFNVNTDTLGAHGNTYFKTFTFDLQNGSTLKISDLFVQGVNPLEKLSDISRAELPKLLSSAAVTEMITAGTTPDEKSFENFFLDDHSLVILFPPYAVAAYAAGPQTLAIPRATLTAILKPEYQ